MSNKNESLGKSENELLEKPETELLEKPKSKSSGKPQSGKKKEAVKKPPYYLGKKKAITTKRGILSDGEEIKAEYLSGGKKALDAFVKSGHVVKS
jgi:hypothetical protein